jgi:hypothetical protein
MVSGEADGSGSQKRLPAREAVTAGRKTIPSITNKFSIAAVEVIPALKLRQSIDAITPMSNLSPTTRTAGESERANS